MTVHFLYMITWLCRALNSNLHCISNPYRVSIFYTLTHTTHTHAWTHTHTQIHTITLAYPHKSHHRYTHTCTFKHTDTLTYIHLTLKLANFYIIYKHVKHTLILKVKYACCVHITDCGLITYQRISTLFIHGTKAYKISLLLI